MPQLLAIIPAVIFVAPAYSQADSKPDPVLINLLSLGGWGLRPEQKDVSKAISMVRAGVNVHVHVYQETPLSLACLNPDPLTTILVDELLNRGAELTHGDDGCLARAVEFAPYPAVVSILDHDHDLDTDGVPALLRAAFRGDIRIFTTLLAHGIAWPTDGRAIALVKNATLSGNPTLVEKILNANPYQDRRKNLATEAMKIAIQEGFRPVLVVTVNAGVNLSETFDGFQDPFHWASHWFNTPSTTVFVTDSGVDFRVLPPRASREEILSALSVSPGPKARFKK